MTTTLRRASKSSSDDCLEYLTVALDRVDLCSVELFVLEGRTFLSLPKTAVKKEESTSSYATAGISRGCWSAASLEPSSWSFVGFVASSALLESAMVGSCGEVWIGDRPDAG